MAEFENIVEEYKLGHTTIKYPILLMRIIARRM